MTDLSMKAVEDLLAKQHELQTQVDKLQEVRDSLNKTLGRAQDPRANGAWLSKLTE